jgi:hypothetical protein
MVLVLLQVAGPGTPPSYPLVALTMGLPLVAGCPALPSYPLAGEVAGTQAVGVAGPAQAASG